MINPAFHSEMGKDGLHDTETTPKGSTLHGMGDLACVSLIGSQVGEKCVMKNLIVDKHYTDLLLFLPSAFFQYMRCIGKRIEERSPALLSSYQAKQLI